VPQFNYRYLQRPTLTVADGARIDEVNVRRGEAAFQPRSRRSKTSPGAVDAATVELIVRLRKELTEDGPGAGPDTICWHLAHHHAITVSAATVARYLTRAGLVTPTPKKRPRSSYLRFQADLPNECWQSDVTHYPLADGTDTEILSCSMTTPATPCR
jgi:hypothetical protein